MIVSLELTQEMNITYFTIATIIWLPFLALTTMPMPGLAVEMSTWNSIRYMTESFHKFKNDFLGDGLQGVIKRMESHDYATRKEIAKRRSPPREKLKMERRTIYLAPMQNKPLKFKWLALAPALHT